MSNLSELLPSGGGQNVGSFEASGTITNGKAVGLRSDGKVEAIATTADLIQGTASLWQAGTGFNYCRALTYIGNNQVLLFYPDAQNSYYGTVVLGNVSGNTVTWDLQSPPVIFETATLKYNSDYVMDSVLHEALNLTVCAYIINSSSDAKMRCFSVSGNTITFGSQHNFNSGGVQEIAICYGEISGNARIWVNYIDRLSGTDYGVADCITVNNINSISNGSQQAYKTDTTSQPSIAFNDLQNMPIITYRDNASSSYGRARVINSGISVPPTFGSQNTVVSGNTTEMKIIYDPNFQQTIIAYKNNTAGNAAINKVTYVSTNSLTIGTPAVFGGSSNSSINLTFNASKTIGTGQGMVVFSDGSVGRAKFVLYSDNGSFVPTLGTETVFSTGDAYYNEVVWGGDNNYVVTYMAQSGGDWLGEGNGFNFSNSGSFIGVTAQAISNGATGDVDMLGGINSQQTSLVIRSNYYLQNNGDINTTNTGTFIGQAVNATTLNLKDAP